MVFDGGDTSIRLIAFNLYVAVPADVEADMLVDVAQFHIVLTVDVIFMITQVTVGFDAYDYICCLAIGSILSNVWQEEHVLLTKSIMALNVCKSFSAIIYVK